MTLAVRFEIASTRLLVQENPQCRVTLENKGRAPISVLHPMTNPSMPMVRVLDLRRGTETIAKRPGNFAGDRYQTLPPGQRLECDFPLLSKADLHEPGEYELSVIVRWDDGRAERESDPVRVTVAPVTARGLVALPIAGAWSAIHHAYVVNVDGEPPQLVRHTLSVLPNGGVLEARVGPPVPLRARVVPSRPANGALSHASWAAWIDAGDLCGAGFDPNHGVLELRRFKLPPVECVLVAPLLGGPVSDALERPGCACLLWLDDPREGGRLLVVDVDGRGRVTAGANAPMPGRRPVWIESQALSTSARRATFAQVTDAGLALGAVAWPKSRPEAPRTLAEWPVTFLGGGCALAPDDLLHGATLVQTRPPEEHRIELVRWTLDAQGAFAETRRDVVDWPYAVPVERALVRLSVEGRACALLAGPDGQWTALDDDAALRPVPAPFGASPLPLDVVFRKGGAPLLVAARKQHGLLVCELDGRPVAGHAH